MLICSVQVIVHVKYIYVYIYIYVYKLCEAAAKMCLLYISYT